ncbi:MAG: 16S rRNA (uracil(1498)-N(3))-methyltransferase [Fidelibacterota bacterium]
MDRKADSLKKNYDSGFKPVSLGINRLRTETACITALSMINAVNS